MKKWLMIVLSVGVLVGIWAGDVWCEEVSLSTNAVLKGGTVVVSWSGFSGNVNLKFYKGSTFICYANTNAPGTGQQNLVMTGHSYHDYRNLREHQIKFILTTPPSANGQADETYLIGWIDDDGVGTISLYYDTDNVGTDGLLIVTGIKAEDTINFYEWNTSSLPQGASFYVYGKIDNGLNSPVCDYSSGKVLIDHRQFENDTLPWRDDGVWLTGEVHIHTVMSDGSYPAAEVAGQAENFGCDFIAITDHGDHDFNIGSPEYYQAVIDARDNHPNLIILEGIEWNVPGAGNGGHAIVFVTASPLENDIIHDFNLIYDWYPSDHGGDVGTTSFAVEALKWLGTKTQNGVKPICSLNHPSRPTSVNPVGFTIDQLRAYSDTGEVCTGFSGDVGHKKSSTVISIAQLLGGYHDPMTAFIGANWDTLLNEGRDWRIRFECDFHNTDMDHCPGEYTKTYVYCPSKSYEGVIKGLRAGCVYGVHGDIITELGFTAQANTQTALMGESIKVNKNGTLTAFIRVKPQATINKIELISNISGTPALMKTFTNADWQEVNGYLEMSYEFTNVQHDFYMRIRGNSLATPVNKWFYSNPIKVKVIEDTIPPTIGHEAIISTPAGVPIIIVATITDNIKVEQAILYWKIGGTKTIGNTQMVNMGNDLYRGTISANNVIMRGLQYAIWATDGKNGTLSTIWTTLTYGTVSSGKIGAVYPTYKSISVPVHPHNPDPKAVLWNWGNFEQNVRLLHFDGTNWVTHNPPSSKVPDFAPEIGYGITADADREIIVSGTSTNPSGYYVIPLKGGSPQRWNSIGHPYLYPVALNENIKFRRGVEVIDPVQAYLKGWIKDSLWYYDGTGFKMVPYPGVIYPWVGYFIPVGVDCEMLIPAEEIGRKELRIADCGLRIAD
ncbi:MAG: CehA/McbA family metallohydrolase [Nitrospirota bacterium]